MSHSTSDGEKFEHDIPQFGLGVFLMSEEGECKKSVLTALEAGYTHIETARAYNNEHDKNYLEMREKFAWTKYSL